MKETPTILIDTREQQPYEFKKYKTKKTKLDIGDYSIENYLDKVALERKSLNDWVQTVIHNKKRFKKELEQLSSCMYASIIVEAKPSEIFGGEYDSNASPKSIFNAGIGIAVYYHVPVYFMEDRQHAREWVENWLVRTWKELEGKIK